MSVISKKRILLNLIATYGRSLFGLVCALITAGWVFIALGEVNFGLFGVVGGLVSFVALINNVFAGAVERFYAYAVGEAYKNPSEGVEMCRKWFNTAVTVHTITPVILIIIGYPVGVYAIQHWLTIPLDRIADCIWIWRFSCISCFCGMISVPFYAMYTAKQYIAELTVYSFATAIANLFFVIYMHNHPGEWLLKYSAWTCLISISPLLVIQCRAYFIFPECRFNIKYMFNMEYIRKIFSFSFYNGLGCICWLLRTQGITVLTNIYFGASVNAAQSIGSSVAGATNMLSNNMKGAFSPAITNACGAGDHVLVRKMAFQVNKIGTALILFFAIPISLELPEILKIWLKSPPQYTTVLAVIALLICVVDTISIGNMLAINATGRIKVYQIFMALASVFTLPCAWVAVILGGGVYGMQLVLLLMILISTLGRVYFARKIIGMSSVYWLRRVAVPLFVTSAICCAIGYIPHFFMTAGILRILVTGILEETFFLALMCFYVLDADEKKFISSLFERAKNFLYGEVISKVFNLNG